MSVPNQIPFTAAVGNGVTTTFPFQFLVAIANDLTVMVDGVVRSDYTVTGLGNLSGGAVIFTTPPAATASIILSRTVALQRTTDYQYAGDFESKTVNIDFDRIWMALQGFASRLAGSLRAPYPEQLAELPRASQRAGTVLGFDSNGNPAAIIPVSQSAVALALQLLQSFGSSLIGFIQSGVGAATRTGQQKMREIVSVPDFRQPDDAEDAPSFQRAINSLPAAGGTIKVPDAAYVLNTEPNWGTKSIYWDIGPGATFSGAGTGEGKFPYMSTNPAQLAVGPFIQSRSTAHSTNTNGGIAAFNVEMIQPEGYGQGQSVGLYSGMRASSSDPLSNGWVQNMVLAVDSVATGTFQAVEIDVDTNSGAALVKGIALSGGGAANPDVAIEITRLSGLWDRGIHIFNASDAIVIDTSVGRGIVIGAVAPMVDSAISIQQLANGAETLFLQRAVNTSPFGYYLRAVNADNTANVLQIDVQGNLGTVGIATAANLRATQGALPGGANTLSLGSLIFPTATAGAGAAVPANVFGFLEIYQGSTRLGLPLFPLS